MRRILLALTVIIGMICLTACGSSDTASEPEGPYLGFTPETPESMVELEVAECALEKAPATSMMMLRYNAEGYNKAVVRLEQATKDGTWKAVEEKDLNLQRNVNKGYMAVCVDFDEGITVNTAMEEIDNSALMNKIQLKMKGLGEYTTYDFFGSHVGLDNISEEEMLAKTDDMDMTSKKAVMIFFEEEVPIINKDGEMITFDEMDDDSVEADINDVYANTDGTFTDAYKQKMLALTMEFVNDEMLEKTPYICAKDGRYMYDSGMYDLGTVNIKKSTPDGKWKNADEEGYLWFRGELSSGELSVDVDDAYTTVTVKTDGIQYKTADGEEVPNEWSYKVPKGVVSCESDTNSFEKPVSAKKTIPLLLLFDEQGAKAKDGINVLDFYKNKDGAYNDIYKDNTFYVVTLKCVAN